MFGLIYHAFFGILQGKRLYSLIAYKPMKKEHNIYPAAMSLRSRAGTDAASLGSHLRQSGKNMLLVYLLCHSRRGVPPARKVGGVAVLAVARRGVPVAACGSMNIVPVVINDGAKQREVKEIKPHTTKNLMIYDGRFSSRIIQFSS
jgi:hypothetical protein